MTPTPATGPANSAHEARVTSPETVSTAICYQILIQPPKATIAADGEILQTAAMTIPSGGAIPADRVRFPNLRLVETAVLADLSPTSAPLPHYHLKNRLIKMIPLRLRPQRGRNQTTTALVSSQRKRIRLLPPDARKPPGSSDWRLYVFKGSETLETVQLGERSCWLFGRERTVADFPIEHLSCSKQHAVLQFRYVEKANEFGERKGSVKPYVIDLESANGTKVNTEKVPEKRFVELASGDVVCFGESTREYVIMLAPRG
ncbi:MAG: hypothetical protein MMC23_009752 [Stictis urceolatum]|nr:hypothetical protein [Stictis urceolata]